MSQRFYVATRKGLFTIERGANAWQVTSTAFLGDPVTIVMSDPRDGSLFAAVGHGHFGAKLHRSYDQGATWREITAPKYPPKPEGLVDKDSAGKEVPWSVKQIWALAPGHTSQPNVLWCGTIPGGLFRSDDSGATWELNRPLWDHPKRKEWMGGGADWPGIHSVFVDPREPRRVFVGVSCGGMWVSEDDGKSWECRATGMRAEFMPPDRAFDPYIQDPHLIVQCAAAPDTLWAQHHNGIFRSNDAGRAWTEITNATPSAFGFAVAVDPKEPNTAWFIPGIKDEKRIPVDGKVVVTRTRDAGNTFEVLRSGLPQEHAYDSVFRHALSIDDEGQQLVFGSTTGSVWVSENRGENWATVSTHLPPVYCVRFESPTTR